MDLAEKIYRVTEEFPQQERYGLVSQMRRAAVSVPSNIAEGFVRKHQKDLMNFLSISLGSLAELESQLLLSNRLGFIGEDDLGVVAEMIQKSGRMITKFRQTLQ